MRFLVETCILKRTGEENSRGFLLVSERAVPVKVGFELLPSRAFVQGPGEVLMTRLIVSVSIRANQD
jgi:hypothetical protein